MKRYLFAYTVALVLAACGDVDAPEAAEVSRAPAAVAVTEPAAVPAAEAPVAASPEATLPEPAQGGAEPRAAGAPAPSGAAPATAPSAAVPRSGSPAPAAAAPAAPAEEQRGPQAILARAERTYEGIRSLEADFTQQVTVPLLNSTQNSRGKIYHRRPGHFLMRFSQPDGDVVVADGTHLWMYYPSIDAKQVMRTRLGEGGQSVDLQKEFLSNATERFSATLAGTESVAGRTADVLVLTPRAASPYRRIRIWVDREDALVRRFEITEENESVRRLELRNLKPNVALGDALFRFTPPPGAQIFEQ
jgi:outer membrane lipoprotein carrier protein